MNRPCAVFTCGFLAMFLCDGKRTDSLDKDTFLGLFLPLESSVI